MIDEMKQADLPEPVFKNEREDFVVTFYNGEYPELYPEELNKDKVQEKNPDKKTLDKKTPDKKTPDKKKTNINRILEICKQPKSISEIMRELDYNSKKTLKRNYIKPLLESGKLKMTIPDKPTSKNQKYITIQK